MAARADLPTGAANKTADFEHTYRLVGVVSRADAVCLSPPKLA
jgi:hypothetical protein